MKTKVEKKARKTATESHLPEKTYSQPKKQVKNKKETSIDNT